MADLGPILNAKWLTLFDPLEMLSYIHVDDCADVLIGARIPQQHGSYGFS